MKKVYFACSIRGGGDKSVYPALIEIISKQAELLTEIFASDALRPHGSPLPENQIWERDIAWIKEADVVIAEVSNPSLGVGYEIAKAEEWGKPVLALYHAMPDRKLSAMISGSPHTTIVEYEDVDELAEPIREFLVSENQ
jgi:nucleoside 2-deoxyribosyltransferase